MKEIAKTLGKRYRNEITDLEAEALLADSLTKRDLAEFIVEAYQRGWITNFNLGLNENGEKI